MTTILTKKKDTTGAPAPGDLTNAAGGAELAVNTFDKRLYTKDSGGNVVEVGTNPTILNIDNIQIDGNTISSTNSNGNINLTPNGTGSVVVSKLQVTGTFQLDGNVTVGDSSADTLTINSTITSNLIFTDNTYDIGASGATRPRNLYLAGNAVVGGNTTLGDASGDSVTVNASTVSTPNGLNFDSDTLVIDAANNRVGIGTTAPAGKLDVAQGNSYVSTFLNSTGAYAWYFNKSRGTTVGTNTIVASGDTLGGTIFNGADGTGYIEAAKIIAQVDGTPGTNDMPGRLLFYTTADGAASGTERMRLDSSGNLGLGVTPSAWNSGFRALQIGEGAAFIGRVSGNLESWVTSNSVFDSTDTRWEYVSTGFATVAQQVSGQHRWFTAPSGTAGNAITFTQAMTLDADGDLGIGITNPASKLDVSGTSVALASDGLVRFLGNSSGADTGAQITFANSTARRAAIAGRQESTGALAGYLQFGTRGSSGDITERMRIDSSGNVGIGISSPQGRLYVNGADTTTIGDRATAALVLNNLNGVANNRYNSILFGGEVGNTNSAAYVGFRYTSGTASGFGDLVFGTRSVTTDTAPTERMRIDSSGNVGIGTSSPAKPLDVNGDALVNQVILRSDDSDVMWTDSGSRPLIRGNKTNNTLAFYTSSAERMRIDSSGNVGIGTSSPGVKLDVVGGTIRSVVSGGTPIVYLNNGTTQHSIQNTSGAFTFFNDGTERMRITSGGEVYIAGTTDQGAYNLQVNGTGVWGAGAYVNGSDERIKDNIAPLDSGLDVVSKLNPVTYKYKEDWSKDQSTQTGFIAQELLTALEGKNYVDGVVQQGGEYMSVAYQNIIPILTKAIQEQQAMIEELKQEVAALKAK